MSLAHLFKLKVVMRYRVFLFSLFLSLINFFSSSAAEIANSINEFSLDGTQGESGWVTGYRNYSQDGGSEDFHPVEDFIAFDQAAHWRGEGWRLVPSNAPWTTVNSEFGHPNGPNNGDEHWAIRRWESDRKGPLAFTWNLREQNDGGSGVGGSLHHNGVQVDTAATNDMNGFSRTYFINVDVGDVVEDEDETNRLKSELQRQLIEKKSNELESAAKIVLAEAQGS